MIKEADPYTGQADFINKSLSHVSYQYFDDKTEDIITYIACIIKPFSEEEFDKDKELKEGSDSDIIVKRLVDSISTRTLEDTIKKLLLEYEQFEILSQLDF